MIDNNFNALLFERHSIRKYTGDSLDPGHVKQILEAGLLAPSSKSSRPWEFVVVDDREILEKLSTCKPAGAKPIAGAAMAIVVCADPAKSDVFIEDCSVAASFMQLQAAALGIGSCWIQIRMRDSADGMPAQQMIQETLGIHPDMQVVMVLTFGISAETRKPVDPDKLLWEKVHLGTWTHRE